jgi:hypothetical protein
VKFLIVCFAQNLPLEFAKELDIRNHERSAAGKPVPHDVFTTQCYRQPSLTEKAVYPEPFRDSSTDMFEIDNPLHAATIAAAAAASQSLGARDSYYNVEMGMSPMSSPTSPAGGAGAVPKKTGRRRRRVGSLSLNVNEVIDNGENDPVVLKNYFEQVVLPLAHPDTQQR